MRLLAYICAVFAVVLLSAAVPCFASAPDGVPESFEFVGEIWTYATAESSWIGGAIYNPPGVPDSVSLGSPAYDAVNAILIDSNQDILMSPPAASDTFGEWQSGNEYSGAGQDLDGPLVDVSQFGEGNPDLNGQLPGSSDWLDAAGLPMFVHAVPLPSEAVGCGVLLAAIVFFRRYRFRAASVFFVTLFGGGALFAAAPSGVPESFSYAGVTWTYASAESSWIGGAIYNPPGVSDSIAVGSSAYNAVNAVDIDPSHDILMSPAAASDTFGEWQSGNEYSGAGDDVGGPLVNVSQFGQGDPDSNGQVPGSSQWVDAGGSGMFGYVVTDVQSASYGGAMPAGMQPADILFAVTGEVVGWVPLSVAAICAMAIACLLVFRLSHYIAGMVRLRNLTADEREMMADRYPR